MRLCRVIMPEAHDKGATITRGTKVVTPLGESIEGVTKVVLTADMNSVWRAELHFFVQPPNVTAFSTFEYEAFIPPLWRRIWNHIWYGYRITLPRNEQ